MADAKLFFNGTEIPISDLRFGPSAEPKPVDPFPIPKLKPWRCEFNVEASDEFRELIQEAHKNLLRQIAEQETRAVRTWSAQMGVTPEQWLRWYSVETTIETYEHGAIKLVTRPVARELPKE